MATVQFCFPNELTIYEVTNVYTDIQAYLKDNDMLSLDLSNVEEVDCAGLQLILRVLLQIDKDKLPICELKLSEIIEKKFSILRVSLPSPVEIGG